MDEHILIFILKCLFRQPSEKVCKNMWNESVRLVKPAPSGMGLVLGNLPRSGSDDFLL